MSNVLVLIFQLIVLIFSVIIHEISHGYVAESLGDPTARLEGRLTLNPIKHLDPVGSFLLPAALFFLSGGSFVFGWAKPVPYNPYNLKNPKSGAGKIAAAGPVSNLFLASIFGIFLRAVLRFGIAADSPIVVFFSFIIYLNVLLAVFNLVPLPPLDGSKVLFAFLPPSESGRRIMSFLERYGLVFLIIFLFFGFDLIVPLVNSIYTLISGSPAVF